MVEFKTNTMTITSDIEVNSLLDEPRKELDNKFISVEDTGNIKISLYDIRNKDDKKLLYYISENSRIGLATFDVSMSAIQEITSNIDRFIRLTAEDTFEKNLLCREYKINVTKKLYITVLEIRTSESIKLLLNIESIGQYFQIAQLSNKSVSTSEQVYNKLDDFVSSLILDKVDTEEKLIDRMLQREDSRQQSKSYNILQEQKQSLNAGSDVGIKKEEKHERTKDDISSDIKNVELKVALNEELDKYLFSKNDEPKTLAINIYNSYTAPTMVKPTAYNNIVNIISIKIDNVADELQASREALHIMKVEDVYKLASFIYDNFKEMHIERIIVACDDGVYVSAGIAAAIEKVFKGSSYIKEHMPINQVCYEKMINALTYIEVQQYED